MRIRFEMPKTDDSARSEQFKMIMAAAAALKISLDIENFAYAWVGDTTRVALAHEGDTPVAFALMVHGRRYFDVQASASVLLCEGPARVQMLEFLKESASVLGADVLYYQQREGDVLQGENVVMVAVKVRE